MSAPAAKKPPPPPPPGAAAPSQPDALAKVGLALAQNQVAFAVAAGCLLALVLVLICLGPIRRCKSRSTVHPRSNPADVSHSGSARDGAGLIRAGAGHSKDSYHAGSGPRQAVEQVRSTGVEVVASGGQQHQSSVFHQVRQQLGAGSAV